MKIYLAARYSRIAELRNYRDFLQAKGYTITSRWLNGAHHITDNGTPIDEDAAAIIDGDDGSTSYFATRLRTQFAHEDLQDIIDCDALIAFTEPPRSPFSRGGRHVELGIAIGLKKQLYIVGHRENIFCWLPDVWYFPTFQALSAGF